MAYTPFLSNALGYAGEQYAQKQKSDLQAQQQALAGKAMQGDPQALQELSSANPMLADQVQQEIKKRKDTSQQQQMQQMTGMNKDFHEVAQNIAKFGSYEEAKQYGDQQYQMLAGKYPELVQQYGDSEFDPEDYAEAKNLFAGPSVSDDSLQSSVDIPGQGKLNTWKKSGKVEFVPLSIEAKQAYIKSQDAKTQQATDQASQVEGARLAAKARQGLKTQVNEAAFKSRDQLPQLDNLERLANVATTGTLAEQKMAAKRFFGADVSNEEEFMAEQNRVVLEAANALKGALSERENAYLEAVGPSIGKSREGNLAIIRNLKTIANNNIKRQEALKKFQGDPVDFDFVGDPLYKPEAITGAVSKVAPKEGQVFINPKTGEKGQIVGGQWQPVQ